MTSARYTEASRLLASTRDVIDERSEGASPPAWCVGRGWVPFLAALDDEAVHRMERDGLAAHLDGAPDDLAALARAVVQVTTLPALPAVAAAVVERRRASPRKQAQVAAFATLVERLGARAARVVDLGSGHGHLTRHLARELGVEAEGWERDPARVAVASALAGSEGARFEAVDAYGAAARLRPTDLVVGLHACGALGDHAVTAAGEAGASVAIIGCCLQRRVGDRPALAVAEGVDAEALTLGRAVLGMGNMRDGDEGVEASLEVRTASRVHRLALRRVLASAGLVVAPGEEMHGVNRRRATGALDELVTRVFAVRGLSMPPREVIAEAERAARADHERARRWELPRAMLSRLVEVWVALDRAASLERRGYATEVLTAFDASVSPRNVAVLGWAPGARGSDGSRSG